MDLKLDDKCALVTGSSRGLGFATAQVLAREGARVAINGRDEARLSEATRAISQNTGNPGVFPLAGDLSQPNTADRLVNQAVASMGALDILVTNTGGPPSGKFEDIDDEGWQKAIDLNLISHVRLIRAALPHLRKSSAPSVLTITSYSVKQPIPNLVLSNSVRSATVGLTKTLALELGNQGIRFNSILPAWTETERIYEILEYRARLNQTTVEEEIKRQAKDSALGRMGTLEEFANAAVFLVSPAASYLTGVMLTVDGGLYKGTF
jgi:3-oxoacyl-[acyl-carrier protein] reductase